MRTKSLILSHFPSDLSLLRVVMFWVIRAVLFFVSILSLPKDLYSQNVGIGTTTPAGRLQINHRSSTIHPGILLQDSTTAQSGLIRFTNVANAKYMQLWGYYAGSFSVGQYLDISSDSTFIATFRGNGNFGIGVLSPVYRLDVNGVINSSSQYRLNGKTVLRWGDLIGGLYRNLYAGDSSGFSNTSGFANTFIGGGAGLENMSGYRNSFLGTMTGNKNVDGNDNTFIGSSAGLNSNGSQNTFIGSSAGISNIVGSNNTMLGNHAGASYFSGHQNTMLGALAGYQSESGIYNVFVGYSAGSENLSGSNNTLLGANAQAGGIIYNNATAIGYRAYVTQNNSMVLGSINGVNGASADTRVGIGTTAPIEKLDIVGNIRLSGEVNNPSTGTANLLPIAFGTIASTGTMLSGSGNFTSSRTAAGSYTIDITGHSYGFSTYTTVVTAVAGPFVPSTTSASGNLLVRLYDLSGVLADGNFHFVVYRQ